MPQVEDRLLAGVTRAAGGSVAATSSFDGASALDAALARRGLSLPKDLLSRAGTGATTLWKLNAAQVLVVSNTSRAAEIDDAFECGRIAATAALSAVHAKGARPLFARLTCACPAGASDVARAALVEGVAVAMSDAGAVLATADVVDGPVLRFEVLVAGIVRPDRIKGEDGAEVDDALILSGPLGAGIYAAAQAKGRLSDDDRVTLIGNATRTNAVGVAFGTVRNVHAVATVGPAGLIASALALADASGLAARIVSADVPALPRALALAKAGCVAPTSSRNWNRDGARVALADTVMPEMRNLLTDPQASGALLVACKRESVDRVLGLCRADDGGVATVIGVLQRAAAGGGPLRTLTIH